MTQDDDDDWLIWEPSFDSQSDAASLLSKWFNLNLKEALETIVTGSDYDGSFIGLSFESDNDVCFWVDTPALYVERRVPLVEFFAEEIDSLTDGDGKIVGSKCKTIARRMREQLAEVIKRLDAALEPTASPPDP